MVSETGCTVRGGLFFLGTSRKWQGASGEWAGERAGRAASSYREASLIPSESFRLRVFQGNASGRVVVQSNDQGGNLHFSYDSWGNLLSVSDGNQNLVSMEYDAYGRQTKLTDLSSGQMLYGYNAYGQLASQTDPLNNTLTISYDVMGRVSTENGPEGITSYSYVSTGNGLNQLQSITGFNGITKSYTYDSYDRMKTESSTLGYALTKTYHYDTYGRLQREDYSTGFGIEHQYTAQGYPDRVLYDDGNSVSIIADANSVNSLGQYTNFDLGNGLNSTITYNNMGMPQLYKTLGVQDLVMSWDISTGNLSTRRDNEVNRLENFVYDNQQRLISSEVGVPGGFVYPLKEVSLTVIGDIEWKHDAGTEYNYYGQYQVRSVKNDWNEIPLDVQTVSYTSFNEPDEIEENIHRVEFVYGPEKTRMQSKRFENGSNTISELRHYLLEMEYEVVVKGGQDYHLHYVPLFGNTMAIVLHDYSTNPVTKSVFYVYKDHLGSWVTVTDNGGNIVARQNFDAWGRKRDPNTWNYASGLSKPDWLIRGYTGHEHFDEFDIVHMNGRLYDPLIGRMFSADNYVQNPLSTQSYNRYTYANNNPVKYNDPTGELVWFVPVVAGAALGAYYGGGSYSSNQNGGFQANPFKWSGDAWKSAFIGGVIGGSIGLGFSSLAASTNAISITTTSGQALTSVTGTISGQLTASALVSSSVSMTMKALQSEEGDIDPVFRSGVLGLASGVLAGFVPSDGGAITGASNGVAGGVYGFFDRYYTLRDQGIRGGELFRYSMLGLVEGAVVGAHMGIEPLTGKMSVVGKAALSSAIVAVPGLGWSIIDAEVSVLSFGLYSLTPARTYFHQRTPHYPRVLSVTDILNALILNIH